MQLLKTKFHIPEFNTLATVVRQRVCRLIHDDSSLVIVSAPAGFGKTTLLSEWARGQGRRNIAWVSLETSEDVPVVFWRYVLSAISSVLQQPGGSALEQLNACGISSIESVLIRLINDSIKTNSSVTIVLDDYHVITNNTIHQGIEFLIDHLPPRMRIIIAGRVDPPLSLSKFRISGKLAEIGAAQLRFNTSETSALLNEIHRLDLTTEDLTAVNQKTEGWAAGLALTVLSIREHADRRTFLSDFTGSHRFILDYLVEEVLSGLTPDIREFMLKISVLERFCAGLCEAVTHNPNSGLVLQEIVKNNFFLVPLDDSRNWYRYHHLFRDFLLKHLMPYGPEDVSQLHARAFFWFKENGCNAEAFQHAILSKKYSEATMLLAENAPDMLSESGGFMLSKYIDQLPERFVLDNPDLCCYAVILKVLAGGFDAAALLDREHFRENKTVKGFKALIAGYLAFYHTGEFVKCITKIETALSLLPQKHATAKQMGELVLNLSLRYSGDVDTAYRRIKAITSRSEISHLAESDYAGIFMSITHADTLLTMGRLDLALELINRNIENGTRKFGETLRAEYGYLYIIKASILRERNALPEALSACKHGLFLGRNSEYIEFVFLSYLEYAKVLAACHNFADAKKAIHRSMQAAEKSTKWGVASIVAFQARIALTIGNVKKAVALMKKLGDFSPEKIPFHRSDEYLAFCRVCLFRKETRRVHAILGYMIDEDLKTPRKTRLLECYILKAKACHVEHNDDEALHYLDKAFQISKTQGHVRIYIDEGGAIYDLFKKAARQNRLPQYLSPYVTQSEKTFFAKNTEHTLTINDFSETFNVREIDILKLMKQGCSNKRIADRLNLSVNTVRWYASRIFAKLDVRRRGEAVAVAGKYKLI